MTKIIRQTGFGGKVIFGDLSLLKNFNVNGAYSILKKALPNVLPADGIEAVGLQPSRWRLASVTS